MFSESLAPRLKSLAVVVWAFMRMGARATLSYPMAFLMSQFSLLISVVSALFLARIVHSGSELGPGYLTFSAVGLAGTEIVVGGMQGLSQELDWTIQQGRLEMLLIEPMSWRLIPIALAAWPMFYRTITAGLVLLVAVGFGAVLSGGDLVPVFVITLLGALAGLALGTLAGSIRVLAKRGDPLVALYLMTSAVLSGLAIPINVLPAPLRALSWCLPTTYVISGLRKALIAQSANIYGPGPWQAVGLLLGAGALLLPASLLLFSRSLEVGRRYGVLAGY